MNAHAADAFAYAATFGFSPSPVDEIADFDDSNAAFGLDDDFIVGDIVNLIVGGPEWPCRGAYDYADVSMPQSHAC